MKKLTYLIFKKPIDLVAFAVLGTINIFNSEFTLIIFALSLCLYSFLFHFLRRMIKLKQVDDLIEDPIWINLRIALLFYFSLSQLPILNIWGLISMIILLVLAFHISFSSSREWGARFTSILISIVIQVCNVAAHDLFFHLNNNDLLLMIFVSVIHLCLLLYSEEIKGAIEERYSEIEIEQLIAEDEQEFAPRFIETQCRLCQHSHLQSYNGVFFVCAFHPYGKEDCEDFSSKI